MNLPAVVLEHLNTVMFIKDGEHGLTYGFWFIRVLAYFNIKCSRRKTGSVNQVFNLTTLENNKCIPRRGSKKSRSIVSEV